MEIILRTAITLLMASLLFGCQSPMTEVAGTLTVVTAMLPSPLLTGTATVTASITSTSSASPTAMPQSTPTPLPTTATATPTLVSLPLHAFEQRCVTMESSLPPDFLTQGIIILEWEYEWNHYKLMALTVSDERPRSLPDIPEIGSTGKISPDGKWLVYIASSDLALDLVVLSPDGEIQETRARKDAWGNMLGWLDMEQVIFQSLPNKPTALYLFNPFTGQEQFFAPEIADRYRYNRELSGWPVWKLVPDPTLTRVAYMREQKGKDKPSLVLVDLESGQTLWELSRFSPGERHIPVWSPDGAQMAVVSDDYWWSDDTYHWEVFTVNREGQDTQWLDVEVNSDGLLKLLGDELSWSPNGRYIGFYGESLYVVDTITRQAFDLCISYGTPDVYPVNVITWSPDSTQIIFQRGDAPAVVIDLDRNVAAPLVDDINIRPIGWLSGSIQSIGTPTP